MSSLKAATSFIRSLRHKSTRTIQKPPQNHIFNSRRFSANPDPEANCEITVPEEDDANITGKSGNSFYLQILTSSGFVWTGQYGTKGVKLGIKFENAFMAKSVDLGLSSRTCGDRLMRKNGQLTIDLKNQFQVQEVLDIAIQKMISDQNIPKLIRKKVSLRKKYSYIFQKELEEMGVMDEINKIITPRYGLKCDLFRFPHHTSWWMSPALICRLFGWEVVSVWLDDILKMLEDLKTEPRNADTIWKAMDESLQGVQEIRSGLSYLPKYRKLIFKDVGEYLETIEQMYPKVPADLHAETVRIESALQHLLACGDLIFKKNLPHRNLYNLYP